MPTVLVTGANGFVGHHVCPRLADAGWAVRGAVRCMPDTAGAGIDYRRCGDLGPDAEWRALLEGVQAVVHLAAHVHLRGGAGAGSEDAFHRINVAGSAALARQAADAGARRFLFMSSIGARVADQCERQGVPATPYQRSKLEAERALARIAAETGLELVALRPPLVYGTDAPGNVARLSALLRRGLPLPLAGIRNRRSVISVENLADAVAHCLEHPRAPGRILELSDGHPMSTPELVRLLGRISGHPARLLPIPPRLLRFVGHLTGQGRSVEVLLADLVTDDRAIRDALGWRPPFPWTGVPVPATGTEH